MGSYALPARINSIISYSSPCNVLLLSERKKRKSNAIPKRIHTWSVHTRKKEERYRHAPHTVLCFMHWTSERNWIACQIHALRSIVLSIRRCGFDALQLEFFSNHTEKNRDRIIKNGAKQLCTAFWLDGCCSVVFCRGLIENGEFGMIYSYVLWNIHSDIMWWFFWCWVFDRAL